MEPLQKPQALTTLEIRKVGDEWLVHDPNNDKLHVLNPTAGKILELCDGTRTAADIVTILRDEMGADPAQGNCQYGRVQYSRRKELKCANSHFCYGPLVQARKIPAAT